MFGNYASNIFVPSKCMTQFRQRVNQWSICSLFFCWWKRYCHHNTVANVWVYIAAGSCLASGQCITAGNYRAFLQTDSQIALSLFSKNPWRLNASKQQIKVGMPAPITSLLLWWVSEWVSDQMAENPSCFPIYSFWKKDPCLLFLFIRLLFIEHFHTDS